MSLYSALTQVLAPFAAKIKGIQTGYDGTEYDSPGEAVREQINDLHVLIGHVPGQAIDASAVAYNDSNVAAELTTVNGRLEQVKEDLNNVSHSVKTFDIELIKGKVKKTVTGKIVILDGKEPVALTTDFTAQKTTIHGRNRFNLANAMFSYSGYSSQHTLSKENNGITVRCNVSQTSAYLYTYTEYIAEFDGDLFVSCEADATGNITDVCVLVQLNGTSQTRLYGRGFLYEKITVAKGDTVRLVFYTHMGTAAYNTVKYKNIMLAYGGLYDYVPYTSDVQNATTETVTYNLPIASNMYDLATTSTGAYKWLKITAENANLPSNLRPADNNTVASSITVTGLPLVAYNQTYNETVGLGLAAGGNIGIYNNQNRTDFLAWLAENPVSISYEGEGSGYADISHDFICGEIIEFGTEAQEVTYYHKAHETNDKVICFGDSITGMFGNSCDYPSMLTLLHDINAVNAGFSGCRWTDHADSKYRPFSMNRLVEAIVSNDFTLQDASPLVTVGASNYNPLYAEHLQNIKTTDWHDIDYVTMFWGTNDWGDGATLKSADDTHATNKQRTNVEDAMKYSISQLVGKYPWLKVIVITPYWRAITTGKDSNVDPNANGEYLYDWGKFIGEVAQDNFNIPIIALYRTLGANVLTNRYFTQDGTHPTEMTKRIIADRIVDTLSTY